MKYSFVTDKGIKRPSNQDCCYAFSPEYSSVFAVVCDGMGGAASGSVASGIAANEIYTRVTEGYREDMSSEEIKELMISAVEEANRIVYRKSREDID